MARDPGTGGRRRKPPPPPRWGGDIRPVQGMPVLQTIWKAMGLPGKPPLVLEDASMPEGVAGYAPRGKRQVMLKPEYVDMLKTLPFPGHRNLGGLNVLAHEYAHVAQPQVLPRWREEGGAEAYAIDRFRHLLKALQIVPIQGDLPGGISYPEFTLRMARGPHQPVRQGQFGR